MRCCELIEQAQHELAFRRIFQPDELAHVLGLGYEGKHVSYGYVLLTEPLLHTFGSESTSLWHLLPDDWTPEAENMYLSHVVSLLLLL